MKIHLVSLEDAVTAIGFRRMAAFIEQVNPDTRVFYVGTRRYLSLSKMIWRTMGAARTFGTEEIDEIAQGLAGADLVAFSSMTGYADLTKALATRPQNQSARLRDVGWDPSNHLSGRCHHGRCRFDLHR